MGAKTRGYELNMPEGLILLASRHEPKETADERTGCGRPRGDVRYYGMSRPDLFDYIGAALLAMIIALWVAHFSLPSLPPDNFPEANQPAGPN